MKEKLYLIPPRAEPPWFVREDSRHPPRVKAATAKVFSLETATQDTISFARTGDEWQLSWTMLALKTRVAGKRTVSSRDMRAAFAISKNKNPDALFRGKWFRRANRFFEFKLPGGAPSFFFFLNDDLRAAMKRTLRLAAIQHKAKKASTK